MARKPKLIEPIWAKFEDVAKAMVTVTSLKDKKEPEQPEEENEEEVKKSS